MYVKDKMSTNLITTTKGVSISEVIQLMGDNKKHRIPVVDDNNNLIGLLTDTTINSNTPNNSSSLSIFEINYMLNNIKVEDIMIKDVLTVNEDMLLEEAAQIMIDHTISCLPVVNGKKLVGIITHSDIFASFIDMLGFHQDGVRYVIHIPEDKVGVLNDISRCFKEKNISISHLVVDNSSRGIEVIVIATGKNANDALDILKENNYDVVNVTKLKNA